MIKIYRCIIGSLMVLAIAFGMWYVFSHYYEQSAVKDGTLVMEETLDACEMCW